VGTLTSVTGYIDRDYSFYAAGTIERFMYLVFGEHLPGTRLYYPWKQNYLTQEVRFASSIGERADYTIGVFLARQQINYPTYGDDSSYGNGPGFDQFLVDHGFASSLAEVQQVFGCHFNQNAFCGSLDTRQRQVAFFADTTIHLTARLEAQLGARVVSWQQDFDQHYAGFFNGGPSAKQQTIKEHTVNPRFNVSYKLTEDLNTYFNAGKGFRFGGVNGPLPPTCDSELAANKLSSPDKFESDSLWTYEIGMKTQLLGRRLSLNGSVFYVQWDGIQTTRSLTCGFRIIENAGTVVSRGAEFDATMLVIDGLELTLSASYTDATLDEPSTNLAAARGDRAPYVPTWKASAFSNYTFALGSRWTGFANAAVTAYGESYTTFSPNAVGRQTLPRATIASLSVGAELDSIRWSIFADNLWDERVVYGADYAPAAGSAPARMTRIYARPRTIGLDIEYRF